MICQAWFSFVQHETVPICMCEDVFICNVETHQSACCPWFRTPGTPLVVSLYLYLQLFHGESIKLTRSKAGVIWDTRVWHWSALTVDLAFVL